MAKLKSRYRKGSKLLKIYETGSHFRGVLYEFKCDVSVSPNKFTLSKLSSANFYEKDGDMDEYRVREYFGMNGGKRVSSDNFIDKNYLVIWTNNDYDEWRECMIEDGADESELTYEEYCDSRTEDLYCERENLDVNVNGVIVAFGDFGLWYGRQNGAKTFGNNVRNILTSQNDYQDWYCDRYNVRCTDIHHDGTNYYLYRVAKNKEQAEKLVNKIVYGNMTENEFMRATKSLRPYIAKVYGW